MLKVTGGYMKKVSLKWLLIMCILILLGSACGTPSTTTPPSTATCSATLPGSKELSYSDQRIGGEWGDSIDEKEDGSVLQTIAGKTAQFQVMGKTLRTQIYPN